MEYHVRLNGEEIDCVSSKDDVIAIMTGELALVPRQKRLPTDEIVIVGNVIHETHGLVDEPRIVGFGHYIEGGRILRLIWVDRAEVDENDVVHIAD